MNIFNDRSKARFFCGSLLLFMFQVCLYYAVLFVPCSLVATCWERADILALLFVMFPCVFVDFPYGVPGQVWYLIVSIPDLCLPRYSCNHLAVEERTGCFTVNCIFPFMCVRLSVNSGVRVSRCQGLVSAIVVLPARTWPPPPPPQQIILEAR